ncbi:MAG TPA: glycosyltransferase family 1 protein [Longimicrobiaceae bacterium]|nr:glycosyltransferase family 1 protein [Longimicrobiaceae bacterium]
MDTAPGVRHRTGIQEAPPAVPRVAVVCDLLEERWPSMDLVAEMLMQSLAEMVPQPVTAVRLCPSMRRRFTRIRRNGSPASNGNGYERRLLLNLDRGLNRFWDYPRLLREKRRDFDVFHVVDHAYGQLVHHLPAERTVVTCHDLHTFQCLLHPGRAPRSAAFRMMTGYVLRGLSRAARVVFDTSAVRDEAVALGLVDRERTSVAHLGVHPAYSVRADANADGAAAALLGPVRAEAPEILHVGGTFGRKRIDLLLRIFAEVKKEVQGARLVRVGGSFTAEQGKLVEELGIGNSIIVLPFLEREVLAAVYRRAALTVLPSEEEGFGLPVIEAMTCGTPVVASDLPVLREVGGEAAVYIPTGDVVRWAEAIVQSLMQQTSDPEAWEARRNLSAGQAAKFTWMEYARRMVTVYREVASL